MNNEEPTEDASSQVRRICAKLLPYVDETVRVKRVLEAAICCFYAWHIGPAARPSAQLQNCFFKWLVKFDSDRQLFSRLHCEGPRLFLMEEGEFRPAHDAPAGATPVRDHHQYPSFQADPVVLLYIELLHHIGALTWGDHSRPIFGPRFKKRWVINVKPPKFPTPSFAAICWRYLPLIQCLSGKVYKTLYSVILKEGTGDEETGARPARLMSGLASHIGLGINVSSGECLSRVKTQDLFPKLLLGLVEASKEAWKETDRVLGRDVLVALRDNHRDMIADPQYSVDSGICIDALKNVAPGLLYLFVQSVIDGVDRPPSYDLRWLPDHNVPAYLPVERIVIDLVSSDDFLLDQTVEDQVGGDQAAVDVIIIDEDSVDQIAGGQPCGGQTASQAVIFSDRSQHISSSEDFSPLDSVPFEVLEAEYRARLAAPGMFLKHATDHV